MSKSQSHKCPSADLVRRLAALEARVTWLEGRLAAIPFLPVSDPTRYVPPLGPSNTSWAGMTPVPTPTVVIQP